MKFIDYIRLAFKNLGRQRSRTTLTITAITIGSLSVILMASILISVKEYLTESLNNFGAFNLVTVVQDPNSVNENSLISAGNGSIDNNLKLLDDTVVADVKKIEHVVSVTPVLAVWFKTVRLEGSDKKQWASVISYTPSTEVFDLPLLAGRKLTDTDMDKIIVGKNFLTTYGDPKHPEELIGNHVILSMDGGMNPDWGDLPPKPDIKSDGSWGKDENNKQIDIKAEIVGIADNGTMDDKQNYISLAWAKRLMTSVRWEFDDTARKACEDQQQIQQQQQKQSGNFSYTGNKCNLEPTLKLTKDDSNIKRNGYGTIIAKIDDKSNAESVGNAIVKMGFGAVTAKQMIDQINQVIFAISIVLGTIGGISLFVAAIGIINTMVMATYERIREIGVMRACGATRAMIRRLFTFEAALLGFWGGLFGLIICIFLTQVAKYFIQTQGADLGNLPIDKLGNFPVWLIFCVISFTTLVGMLSGLGPAIKAARLNPVDALRYE